MLEVRMLDFDFRVPYGVNNSNKGSGVLPDVHTKPAPKIIRFDMERRVALFAPGIEVPLVPFMGIMAVMPRKSSRTHAAWNLRRQHGLQSAHPQARASTFRYTAAAPCFYTGDSHAVQGDGEVNGTAIEASLSPTLQFIVHKGVGQSMKWPLAEDASNYYVMGMDVDLNVAMREAVQETLAFLGRERGLSPGDAYSLASIGVNYTVAEAVDHVLMVLRRDPEEALCNEQTVLVE
jgi:acetamidase/formamidase